MNIDRVDFIPRSLLDDLQVKATDLLRPVFDDELNEVHETYLDIQRAEALEALGIVQFYSGDWSNAIRHLEKSISYTQIIERRGLKRVAMTQLMVSIYSESFVDLILHRLVYAWCMLGVCCCTLLYISVESCPKNYLLFPLLLHPFELRITNIHLILTISYIC